jgi:predicted O-methyltransferase YrrM
MENGSGLTQNDYLFTVSYGKLSIKQTNLGSDAQGSGETFGQTSEVLKTSEVLVHEHFIYHYPMHDYPNLRCVYAKTPLFILSKLTKTMNIPPKLSIVATARNDNHGGHLLRRMQIFINGILALSHKYQLPVELILVEWNPPPDQPKLAQALSWPKQHDFCAVRIIEVPSAIHQRYKYAAKLPLYQMIAKNVGIRRAHGPFILATNIDILCSEELFAFLATGNLEKGKIYRVNRYDVHQDVPLEASIEEQLTYCQQHLIRINEKYGTSNLLTGEFHRTGYYPSVSLSDYLHTNACGDFQLMAREDWETVRGYAELDMYSFYLDSALAYLAYFLGITQVVLPDPMRTYHIEHDSGFKDEESQKLWDKLSSVQIPRIENFEALIVKIAQEHRSDMFNDDQWGLVSDSLPEQYLVTTTFPPVSTTMRPKTADLANLQEPFRHWFETFATASNCLYYRDQSPESLMTLVELVHHYQPTQIIELGTLSGVSLRTWLATNTVANIVAINFSFQSLYQSQQVLPVELARVTLLEQNILTTDFGQLWNPQDTVLLYIDAHDQPQVPIMEYVLRQAWSILPRGSVVVVDDLWYSPILLSKETAPPFLETTVLNDIDPLQCFEGYYAPYWEGGSFFGFAEMVPLMRWVNQQRVELHRKVGVKSVWFERN